MKNIDFSLIDQMTDKINEMIASENEQLASNLLMERLILLDSMIPTHFYNDEDKNEWKSYLTKMHQENEQLLSKIKQDRDILKKSLLNYDLIQCYIDESIV